MRFFFAARTPVKTYRSHALPIARQWLVRLKPPARGAGQLGPYLLLAAIARPRTTFLRYVFRTCAAEQRAHLYDLVATDALASFKLLRVKLTGCLMPQRSPRTQNPNSRRRSKSPTSLGRVAGGRAVALSSSAPRLWAETGWRIPLRARAQLL